jgi:peptidyl-prolyl cis-trans isomerase SurA
MIARTFASHLKSASKNIFQANNQNQGRVFAGHLVAISLLLTPLTVTEVLANTELQAETPMDSILTIVNDDVITTTELEHRLKKTRTQLTASGVTLPPEELLRKQILERFILERIQLQLAAKLGIRSNDQDIERALGIIAKKNKITYNALLNKIKQQNIDLVSYRQQIGRQVIIQKLSEREVNRRTRVSESEIDLFIENRNRQIGETDTYNLSHIMIPIPENASSE